MGTGKQKPEFGFVGLAFDQIVHEGYGLGVFVLTENAAGETQLPFGCGGLEKQGVPEGTLGSHKVFLGDVGGAKKSERISIPAAQFDSTGEGLDGGIRASLLQLDQAEVFIGSQIGRELAGGTLKIFGGLVGAIQLIGDGTESEVKDSAGFRRDFGFQLKVGFHHVRGGQIGDFGEGFFFGGR